MKFAYPEFLYFLAALAVPIIIHLFNFRKFKRVYFTNVRFLKEVKQETQSKSKLKHLLVLLMRLLAITFMVFAFAQPFIPADNSKAIIGTKAVSIYIDNSFSMDAVNKNGPLLEVAKKQAIEIAEVHKPTDQFQLITNDFEGKHQRMYNRDEFIAMVDEIAISPAGRNISEVVTRQYDALANADAKVHNSYLLSDFQRSVTDLSEVNQDSSVNITLIPIQAEAAANLYIDTIWFKTPVRQINQQEELTVRIANTSDKAFENVPIKLTINEQQKAIGTFNVEPQTYTDTTLFFSNMIAGIQHAEISITDYPITFDDHFYFSYEVANKIPVYAINSKNVVDTSGGVIRSLFSGDEFYTYKESAESNIDYSSLANYNLVILNELQSISSGLAQELNKFVENGGSLIVFPATTIDYGAYREFALLLGINNYMSLDTFNNKVASINLEHQLYQNIFEKIPKNLDLPVANSHYKIAQNVRSNEEHLLRLQNGDAFLSKYDHSKGKVYLSAVPLSSEFSNFTRHAIFVASMLRIAEFSLPSTRLYYTIGKNDAVQLNNVKMAGETFNILHTASEFNIWPEHQHIGGKTNIFLHGQVRDAGNYLLKSGNQDISGLGFNYQRTESELAVFEENDEVQNLTAEVQKYGLSQVTVLSSSDGGISLSLTEIQDKKYWRHCIFLALLFLAFEILLLKFWK